MTSMKSLAPGSFGQLHRNLLQSTIEPLAKQVGARALSDKLTDAVRSAQRNNDAAVDLVADNLAEVRESRKGAIPLKEAWDIDQRLAEDAAVQAAKATGGVLTPESARFLPYALRADYEKITGEKIVDRPGVAVAGVDVKGSGAHVDVSIDFKRALAGVTAKDVVLAVTDHLVVSASRLDGGVADPALPPYWIVISPRENKLGHDTQLKNGNGWRSFTDPTQGHLIATGGDTIELMKGSNATKAFQTVTFQLDAVNDYGTPVKPASTATKAVREAWDHHFDAANGAFDFDKGTKAGTLEQKTLAEVRDLQGIKVLLSAIRDNAGSSVTKLVKDGLLEFVVDNASNSLAVVRRVDGESEHWLSVVDLTKHKWVGTWAVSDDGTKEWNER